LATTIFAMLWLFLVFLLTVPVIRWHIVGRHEWLLTGLLLPFWAVCYWSVRAFLQLLMLNSGMGQTTVESPICRLFRAANIRPSLRSTET